MANLKRAMMGEKVETFSECLELGKELAESKGYSVEFTPFLDGLGYGENRTYSFRLFKGDKLQRKALHLALTRFGLQDGTSKGLYEFVGYIL